MDVRLWAAWALIKFGEGGSQAVMSTLIPIAKGVGQQDWDLRGKRSQWLDADKLLPDPQADQRSIDALRCQAVRLLGKIATPEAWDVIRSLVNEPHGYVGPTARAQLQKMPKKGGK